MEETGLDISDAIVEQIDYVFDGENEKILRDSGEKVLAKMTFYNFTIKLVQSAKDILFKADDDFVDVRWFNLTELKTVPLSPPSVDTLQKISLL